MKKKLHLIEKKIIIKEGKTTELKKISTQRGNPIEWKKITIGKVIDEMKRKLQSSWSKTNE